MPRAIRGVLFDLGSTLWQHVEDDCWLALEAEANAQAGALLHNLGRGQVAAQMDDMTLGAAVRQSIEHAIARAHHSEPDEEPDFGLIAQQALWSHSIIAADHSLGMAVFEALRIRAPQSRLLFDDSIPTLIALRERGYAVGIATNRAYGGEPFIDDLRQMGLLSHFKPEAIAISADLGVRKPNPALFQHALAGLGLAPDEVAMVGNSIIADVWGAQRCGLFAVWKPDLEDRTLAQEDLSAGNCHTDEATEQEAVSHLARADADLVIRAQQRAHTKDARTISMAPPDAVISRISDLLYQFVGTP